MKSLPLLLSLNGHGGYEKYGRSLNLKMSINSFYIRGWKGLSEYTGFHPRTLQRWHLERGRLQVVKSHAHSKTSRWVTTPDKVREWFISLGIKYLKTSVR